jgi:hypothetical protein
MTKYLRLSQTVYNRPKTRIVYQKRNIQSFVFFHKDEHDMLTESRFIERFNPQY